MKEKLLKIIKHYGVMKQLKYFQSEVFELNEAIINCEIEFDSYSPKLGYDEHKNHITEEIADVMVMLNQFMCYYGIEETDILKTMFYKIDRQLERIEKENTDNSKINNTIEYIESIREYFEEGLQPEFDNIINKLKEGK